ncbi:N-acetylglucosaminidase, alpha [Seminavis robusta]|uniref:COX assembly mitochondrial protein n=1 Tax=Seminavis robusta TaxID=568900 RepID=A0A9N8HI80_9STRA|nr:N-acetylglucosaminidase, alpha [Seminavis robusta]|eukprot:Sro763_g198880.1 N-acetylglucosaminidase, alpha (124) ;mRNA; f:24523-24894
MSSSSAPSSSGSSNSNSSAQLEAEYRAQIKETSREGRLSFKNRAEDLLRYECKEEAKEICKPFVQDFAECANEQGLFVVFRCQSKLKALNSCMAKHNGEEAWQKYKQDHQKELEIRSTGKKVF